MQAIWSFSCSLAITRSSLFGLHLGRKTFQNSFNNWVTFSKMSNWNVKPGPKNVKTCECSDNKRNVVLRTTRVRRLLILQTSASENVLFSFFFFFLVYYIHVIVYWEHARRSSLGKNVITKALLSREFPFYLLWKSGFLRFCWLMVYSVSLVLT